MTVTWCWAMPNSRTFSITPIAEILRRLVGDGKGWVDPYANESQLAERTNDSNPDMPSMFHMDALEFLGTIGDGTVKGVLLDPPYSERQIREKYDGWGNVKQITPILDEAARAIKAGGLAISFGWNSNGLGKNRGFLHSEVHLIAHGGQHNDTIVTVEQKQ